VTDPAATAAGVRQGDPAAMLDLYAAIRRCCMHSFRSTTGAEGQDFDDRLHDAFLTVVEALRAGRLRDPRRLMGYVAKIIERRKYRMIAGLIAARQAIDFDGVIATRAAGEQTAEQALLGRERAAMAEKAFRGASPADREILSRFYIDRQPWKQICVDMGLTATGFRLLKWRAKARVTAKVRALVTREASPLKRAA
jgi:RNA polymerase sigma-70 factor (ECF subfamily)